MAPAAASPVARPRIAITHVTLIDPRSGPQPDVTIVLDGDRIAEVGPSATTPVPAGASVHDGTGSFAIPGLWDAHVHVSQIGDGAMRLLVANGVTSVRDMGSAFADVAHWRTVRCAGGPAPRVYSPGPKLDGRGDEQVDSWLVSSPEDARRAVARLKAIGVDFIKVHYGLSRPVYDAIMAESRRVGLTVAGHILDEIPAQAAAAAGQRTIEHGRGMLPCSAQLRSRIRAEPEPAPLAGMCEPEAQAEPIEPMLAALARAGTWLTPTLASWRGRTLDRAAIAKLDGIRYASAALEERWGDPESPGPVERELLNSFGPLAAAAHRAGVALLAGTDAGDPFVVPGFALHDELALLVAAGVPPLVALRSATFEPARALGVADTVGSIARAQAADIVLLGADPLADIHNTRRIVAVVVNGRWFTADQLAALIAPLRRAS
jgi:imidazolonepropionase-like amidohydrolase